MDHKLTIDNPLAALHLQVWRCSCGDWVGKVPRRGSFGTATSTARLAQAKMYHARHADAARRKEKK